jgi:hypothetical protein
MIKVDLAVDLDVPVESAWRVLADFAAFLEWAGDGEGTIEIDGDGIGMIRHMDLPGVGKMAERLDKLDHDDHTIGYTLAYGNPIGLAEYSAVVRLEPNGEGNCRIIWHGEFSAADGYDSATVAESLEGSYQGMSAALAAHSAR